MKPEIRSHKNILYELRKEPDGYSFYVPEYKETSIRFGTKVEAISAAQKVIEFYKAFEFKYRRGNAEKESQYDIYHEGSLVSAGLESKKACWERAREFARQPQKMSWLKFMYNDRLPKKKAGKK